jgi:hypothetical protein
LDRDLEPSLAVERQVALVHADPIDEGRPELLMKSAQVVWSVLMSAMPVVTADC